MAEHAQLDAPCKDGRLIITRDAVSIHPLRRTRRARAWTLPRFAVSGVDMRHVGVSYELAVQTHEGRTYAVTELNPTDAFAAVSLLGCAWVSLPGQRRVTRRLGETAVRCKWGQLVIAPERVALQPRLGFRRHGWVLPRAAVSGVGFHGVGGERLVHDLVVYTLAGTMFPVYEVAPTDALTVARLLGFVRNAYPIGHAPIRPPAPPTMPLPGAGFSPTVDVVIVPAPTHEPRRPHAPSPVGGFHTLRSSRDAAPHAEPIGPPLRHGHSQGQPGGQPAEREQAGTEAGAGAGAATHGFSTPAGMLAALALLAAGTIATVTGHGLPEGWGAPNSPGRVDGGMLPRAATAAGQTDIPDADGPRHAKQGAAAAPTKHQATPTPARPAPAVASQRPPPTARPIPTATATPAATATAQPTATATPVPTATPIATATPTPAPTVTPTDVPSATATATTASTVSPKPSPSVAPEPTPQPGGAPTPVTTR